MEITDIFSLTFYFFFTIYIVIGLYGFFLPSKYPLKVLYTILCIVLSMASFAFAIMNSKPSAQTAFMWRRFSIITFAFAYPLILYCVLKILGYVYIKKTDIAAFICSRRVSFIYIRYLYTDRIRYIFHTAYSIRMCRSDT